MPRSVAHGWQAKRICRMQRAAWAQFSVKRLRSPASKLSGADRIRQIAARMFRNSFGLDTAYPRFVFNCGA
jgi:hypothetical protein